MQECKWKVGGKYRLVDVVGFNTDNSINYRLSEVLSGKDFTVEEVNQYGKVTKVVGMDKPDSYFHWFEAEEIKYFEEITEQSPTQDNTSAVVEWLNKFLALAIASPTNEGICVAFNKQLCLETMHGNVHHTQNIVDSINNRYSQLIEQANKTKREELLAEIVKAKEVYESNLAKLNELEKGL